MSNSPILYSFRRCPYAMRARMAIAAANIRCELREVSLSDKPEQMLTLSSKGTVPVLQLEDGRVIDESLDVMQWALKQSDPESWLNGECGDTQTLIAMNDGEFKAYLDRYKYHVRYPEQSQLVYREKAEEFLQLLENKLEVQKGQALLAEKPGLADIAIFPFIRQFSRVDMNWFGDCSYSLTRQWLHNLEATDRFKLIMKKFKKWEAGEEAVYFP
ncbi:MAG: glutathione S-transferase [Gammaproteobacteria bacterium]|nr:glutathione S-transferase [Gammaproteobacteria bacterium]